MSRFTGRQITTMVVAVCLAIIAFPVGVLAASLAKTATCDADSCAHVDAGKLRVGDGSGALTVNGSVLTYSPSTIFSRVVAAPFVIKPGIPVGKKLYVTSLSISNLNGVGAVFRIRDVTDQSPCSGAFTGVYYRLYIPATSSQTVSFPTPLVLGRCAALQDPLTEASVTGYVA